MFWLLPVIAFFALPEYRVLGSQILITGLFAVSLDLILGYAGIVSLGHAAFFGLGAYAAGLLALHGWTEPLSGLLASAAVAAMAGYLVSFLVVRGGDLTRLMVTLGIGLMLWEGANKAAFITGGVDGLSFTGGKLFGTFGFDLGGRTAFLYALIVVFLVFVLVRRLVNSPLGLSVRGIRESGKRMLTSSWERVCLDERRHAVVLALPFARALGVAAVGIGLMAIGWPASIPGVALQALGAAIALRAVWNWEQTRVVLTTDKLFVVSGTLRKRAAAVRLARIGAVEIEQGLAGRLLGYGTIVAGDLEIEYVPKPRQVYGLVERLTA